MAIFRALRKISSSTASKTSAASWSLNNFSIFSVEAIHKMRQACIPLRLAQESLIWINDWRFIHHVFVLRLKVPLESWENYLAPFGSCTFKDIHFHEREVSAITEIPNVCAHISLLASVSQFGGDGLKWRDDCFLGSWQRGISCTLCLIILFLTHARHQNGLGFLWLLLCLWCFLFSLLDSS